jgi:hypothetical protein
MREIKFRGICIAAGEPEEKWVFGDLIQNKGKVYISPQANSFTVDRHFGKLIVLHEVDPGTVGQFTLITDKNGKGVYEKGTLKLTCDFEQRKEELTDVVQYCDGLFYCNDWTLSEIIYNYMKGTMDFEVIK